MRHHPSPPHGIPTVYRGFQYRSRLEAKWAAFFELLGWSFQYEPFDLGGWIPDFLIPARTPILVEVKPITDVPHDVVSKMNSCDLDRQYELLLVGCMLFHSKPAYSEPICIGWARDFKENYVGKTGLHFANTASGEECSLPGGEDDVWDRAIIFGGDGEPFDYCSCYGSPTMRINGRPIGTWAVPSEIFPLWHRAGNLVQWRGRQSEVGS